MQAIDEAEWLRRGKAKPGSYAGDLLRDVHEAIFTLSLDLKADYENYFVLEYVSFSEYLEKRMEFTQEFIKRVRLQFPRAKKVIYFRVRHSFLEDEDLGEDFLRNLLTPGRKK